MLEVSLLPLFIVAEEEVGAGAAELACASAKSEAAVIEWYNFNYRVSKGVTITSGPSNWKLACNLGHQAHADPYMK